MRGNKQNFLKLGANMATKTRKTTRADTLQKVSDMVGITKKQYPDIEALQALDSDKLSRTNEAQLKGIIALCEIANGV